MVKGAAGCGQNTEAGYIEGIYQHLRRKGTNLECKSGMLFFPVAGCSHITFDPDSYVFRFAH